MNSQFSVPKPCHENWDAMTPVEQGRFCSVCSKTVTDFTQMSSEDIVIYLRKNSNSGVCGRFRDDQLKEQTSINIPRAVLYSQTKFINMFLLALLVTMGPILFSCQNNTTKGEVDEVTADSVALHKKWTTPAKTPDIDTTNTGRHTTVGIVSYPEDSGDYDSIPQPPPVQVKEAPKADKEAIRIK